jgi:hypothetical protein
LFFRAACGTGCDFGAAEKGRLTKSGRRIRVALPFFGRQKIGGCGASTGEIREKRALRCYRRGSGPVTPAGTTAAI